MDYTEGGPSEPFGLSEQVFFIGFFIEVGVKRFNEAFSLWIIWIYILVPHRKGTYSHCSDYSIEESKVHVIIERLARVAVVPAEYKLR